MEEMVERFILTIQSYSVRAAAAYLMTFLTGVIFLGLWRALHKKWDDDGHIYVLYYLLRVILALFLIPAAYCVLWLPHVDLKNKVETGTWFWYSPVIYRAVRIFWVIWFVGFCWKLFELVRDKFLLKRIRSWFEPADEHVQQILVRVKTQLHMKRKVKIYQGDVPGVPFITGAWRPKIYVPIQCGAKDEELEIVLIHELIHCKYHDLLWKYITYLINCIYWFNPLASYLSVEVNRWTESHCDYRTGQESGGYKLYCSLLAKMAAQVNGTKSFPVLTFYEDKLKVKERIERMYRYSMNQKQKKVSAVLLLAVFLFASSTTALATGFGVSMIHDAIASKTAEGVQEVLQERIPMDFEEFYAESFEESNQGYELIENDDTTNYYSVGNINWTFSGKQTKTTSIISVSDGSISVCVFADPNNKLYDVGIIEPDGGSRWVQGTGKFDHDFVVSKSGGYKVFIRNVNTGSLTVSGAYEY